MASNIKIKNEMLKVTPDLLDFSVPNPRFAGIDYDVNDATPYGDAINKMYASMVETYKQFMDLYNFVAGGALVNLLPSEGNFQDQVYVANLGIYLPHIKNENHIILSNFTSDPRKGEELVGEKYFNQMGYKTAISLRNCSRCIERSCSSPIRS